MEEAVAATCSLQDVRERFLLRCEGAAPYYVTLDFDVA